jgi:hypothetical protein
MFAIEVNLLEQKKASSLLLFGQILVDDLVSGCLIGKPAAELIKKQAVLALYG